MPPCLVCLAQAVPAEHVMCRACYDAHGEIVYELKAEPLSPLAVRQKLWGQRFEKNRTPWNRARIAYAAHLLALQGHGEILHEVRRMFTHPEAPAAPAVAPAEDPRAAEATEVSALEEALGVRDERRPQRPGDYRTKDGHWVRSKSERDIADFLFNHHIRYQYERPLTIGGVDLYPDFFLPDFGGGIYLEHFGLLHDARYRDLANKKVELFKRERLTLVATDEKDATDMDAALRRKLSRHVPNLNRA